MEQNFLGLLRSMSVVHLQFERSKFFDALRAPFHLICSNKYHHPRITSYNFIIYKYMKIPFHLLTQTSLAMHLRKVILWNPTRGLKIKAAQIILTSLGNAISSRLRGRDFSKFSVRSAPTDGGAPLR